MSAQTVLQNGLPAQKAQLVANLCKNFNVPLQELDSYLAGQIPAQGAQPPLDAEMIARQAEERVFARLNQQRMQTASARATQERDSFAAKHEFFDDLREDMADIIETKAKRGVDLSLEDAYNLAVKLHPEISDVLRQREAAKQVATVSAATQRAKTAASSVRTQPISGMKVSNGTGSIRETLEAVYEEVNGR